MSKAAPSSPPCGSKLDSEGSPTKASQLAELMRADIICGKLPPGSQLKVQELGQLYDAGMIPTREALSRLTNGGFVEARDQRGFFVRQVSVEELLDLTRLRLMMEPAALQDAIENGGLDWEERILSTHYRMSRLDVYAGDEEPVLNKAWAIAHDDFHKQLVSACSSPWLMKIVLTLQDQTARYYHISAASGRLGDGHLGTEHQAILDAVLGRKVDLAIGLLREHISACTEFYARANGFLSTEGIVSASGAIPWGKRVAA